MFISNSNLYKHTTTYLDRNRDTGDKKEQKYEAFITYINGEWVRRNLEAFSLARW